MQVVKHKVFGVGEVVVKESRENGSYITVLFENGDKKRFSIPESFMLGVVSAEGSLKEEVDAAIAERNLRDLKKAEEIRRAEEAIESVHHIPRVRGDIANAYEAYLINKGYATETPGGNPSTVYSYIGAIERHVLDSEHITWDYLKDNIDAVVKKYDIGGAKEDVGAISNSTVINALKRFKDFVNP